jgi:hypothetical protein
VPDPSAPLRTLPPLVCCPQLTFEDTKGAIITRDEISEAQVCPHVPAAVWSTRMLLCWSEAQRTPWSCCVLQPPDVPACLSSCVAAVFVLQLFYSSPKQRMTWLGEDLNMLMGTAQQVCFTQSVCSRRQ